MICGHAASTYRHVPLGEVGDLEPHIHVRDRQRGLQHDILGERELAPGVAVDLGDQRADFLTSVQLLPLVRGHRQQQIGVGEHGAAAVDADEDFEHLVGVLIGDQEVVHRLENPHRLVQVVEPLERVSRSSDAPLLQLPHDRRASVGEIEDRSDPEPLVSLAVRRRGLLVGEEP